jgi:hypothetical protein
VPVTPYHLGPGILVKAMLRGSFSLIIFGWTQLLMDLQPLIVLLTGRGELHGFTHTCLGASLIALLAAVTGKLLIDRVGTALAPEGRKAIPMPWWVAFVSAFIGSLSHVALDSIIYLDMQPFAPASAANDLLGLLSRPVLRDVLIFSGLIGTVLYVVGAVIAARRGTRFRRTANPPH